MGYTHYWYRQKTLPKELFKAFSIDCKKLADELKVPIQFEYDCSDPPVFSDDLVRFNGFEGNGHETFYLERINENKLERINENKQYFTFCKTARKPYDILVACCLIAFAYHFENCNIKVVSDGDDNNEWNEYREACQKVLGYGEDFHLEENDKGFVFAEKVTSKG